MWATQRVVQAIVDKSKTYPSLSVNCVIIHNELQNFLSFLKSLSKSDQSISIKDKIQSLKYSKKSIRVNFKYSLKSLKINELTLQKASLNQAGRLGMGGGIKKNSKESKTQNLPSFNPSDLVRNEDMAPHSLIFLTIPFEFPNEIHGCKKRNL